MQTTENSKNKSPVLYEENCIGLESWCKSHIQCYSHSVLLKNRKKLSRKQLSQDDMKNLNHVLMGGLLVQPNVVTFWNMKRELVENEILTIQQELYFTEILLSMYPKSYESFSYRKWLLTQNYKNNKDFNFFINESRICESTASKTPNNYHSWNYRIWCMEILWRIHPEIDALIISELTFSLNWITNHISEQSGYNYRQYLINNLKESKSFSYSILKNSNFNIAVKYLDLPFPNCDPTHTLQILFGRSLLYPDNEAFPKYVNMISLLVGDLSYISSELNYLYSKHKCIWNYRKFLIMKLLELLHDYHGLEFKYSLQMKKYDANPKNESNILDLEINELSAPKPELHKKITASNFYTLLIKKEGEFIEACRNTDDQSQFNLPKLHWKWLHLANIYKPLL